MIIVTFNDSRNAESFCCCFYCVKTFSHMQHRHGFCRCIRAFLRLKVVSAHGKLCIVFPLQCCVRSTTNCLAKTLAERCDKRVWKTFILPSYNSLEISRTSCRTRRNSNLNYIDFNFIWLFKFQWYFSEWKTIDKNAFTSYDVRLELATNKMKMNQYWFIESASWLISLGHLKGCLQVVQDESNQVSKTFKSWILFLTASIPGGNHNQSYSHISIFVQLLLRYQQINNRSHRTHFVMKWNQIKVVISGKSTIACNNNKS